MKRLLLGALAGLAAVAFWLLLIGAAPGEPVPLDVELKFTDENYRPLPGERIRLVFGLKDWQAPDAGVRIVTAQDGTAQFAMQALVDRRWIFVNIGFTPLSMALRADHVAIALELPFVMPQRQGDDMVHRWLYTADIDRLSGGDCRTDDLDKVYEAGPDGKFTKLVGTNAAGPNFDGLVDGWRLSSAGYKLWDFSLEPAEGQALNKSWHLKLGLMRKPKPVIRQ
jgi:hypothetical protein